jgi:WD40 repeat protein
MDSSCAISTIVDLGLDPDPSPRRLVRLGAHWLAYGGDDGTLVLLETTAVQVARTYDDDGIRAVAVSHDQLRVVVGFASGKTDIYAYTAASLTAGAYHPFLQQLNSNETNDETEISYSQLVSSNDTTHADETVFAGPQFDTAVRDLVFVREYHVAMACERSLVVVNASSSETVTTSAQLPLKAAAELAYDKTGVRGLSLNRTNHIVSSLGLNGRVCHWDCSDVDPTQWKLLHREESRAVLKADVGEVFTTCDVYDRSLRPTWVSDTLVAIGGQTQLQLRSLRHDGTFQIQDQPASDKDNENGIKGHLETIVKIEALGSSEYLASCGRDGRVIVWHVKEDPKEVRRKFC